MRTKSNSTGLASETGEVLQVTLLWGDQPLEVRQFEPTDAVWAGGSLKDDVVLDTEPFALARWRNGNWWACEPVIAAEPPRVGIAKLGPGERVRIPIGTHSAELQVVKRARRARERGAFDFRFLKAATIAGMVGVTLLVGFAITDLEATAVSESIVRGWTGAVASRVEQPVRTKPVVPSFEPTKTSDTPSPVKFGATKIKSDGDIREAKLLAAKKAGLLGMLDKFADATGTVFSDHLGSQLNVGFQQWGTGVASSEDGSLNWGPRNVIGGGGGGRGISGIGRLNTHGGGPRGIAINDLHGKAHTTVIVGDTHVMGGCERDVIRKVIDRNAPQIRLCYETALAHAPTLAGKMGVTFTIDSTGGVSDATIVDTEIADDDMQRCVVNRILRWKFAEPKGDSTCVINYPWVFRAAGTQED